MLTKTGQDSANHDIASSPGQNRVRIARHERLGRPSPPWPTTPELMCSSLDESISRTERDKLMKSKNYKQSHLPAGMPPLPKELQYPDIDVNDLLADFPPQVAAYTQCISAFMQIQLLMDMYPTAPPQKRKQITDLLVSSAEDLKNAAQAWRRAQD
jgi:hypothetical protein